MVASANFTVNGLAVPPELAVAASSLVTLSLLSASGADTVTWSIIGNHAHSATNPTITPAGTPLGKTATFTMPAGDAQAYLIQCQINGGVDSEGVEQSTYTKTAIVGVVNTRGVVPFAFGENFERSGTHGTTEALNRLAEGGTGLGDVAGPAGATAGNLPQYSSSTGKSLSDSGIPAISVEFAYRPQSTYTAASNDAALADARKCIITTRATAISLRIRLQASIAWLSDTLLGGINTGAGTLTVTAEGGVTLNGSVTVPQNGWWWAKRTAANTWQCFTGGTGGGTGDLKADGTVPLTATWALGNQSITTAKSYSYASEINNTGASPAINFTTGDCQKLTLSGNTSPTFVAPLGIGWVQVCAIGDGTQRTITWPGSVVGTLPAPSAGSGVRTFYPLFCDGTNYHYSADATAIIAGNGILDTSGTWSVKPDGPTVGVSASGVKVADASIGNTQLATGLSWGKLATAVGDLAFTGFRFISYTAEFDNGSSSTADTITFANGLYQKSTLTGNCTYTLVPPTGVGEIQLKLIQDGTGSRTVTWPVGMIWPASGAPTLSTTPGDSDIVVIYWDGTNYYGSFNTGGVTTGFLKADGTVAMAADFNLNSHKAVGMSPGTVGTDGVNLNQLNAVAAAASGKFGFQYTFATSTADADPGAGLLRFNNAAPASVTQIYLDLVDADGNTLTNWIASLDDALGAVKGFIYFRDIADDTKWGQYRLDSITSPGGYVKLNVTHIASGAGGLPSTTAAGTLLSFDAWGNGPAAGNGLTGTSTLAVLPEDTTITVGAGGVKRPAITGIVTIAAGSNASAIADGAIPRAKLAPETEHDNGNSSTADTIAWANGTYQKSTLTGNCTYTFTPPASGVGEIQLRLIQDGTGSRTVTWPALMIWPAGGAPTLSTVAGDQDIVSIYWDGTNYYGSVPPEVPDGRVARWDDASGTLFTSTLPTAGGKIVVDPSVGLKWQGKNGVETTIAAHGGGAARARKFIEVKKQGSATVTVAAGAVVVASITPSDIGTYALAAGTIIVTISAIARDGSGSDYTYLLKAAARATINASGFSIASSPFAYVGDVDNTVNEGPLWALNVTSNELRLTADASIRDMICFAVLSIDGDTDA